MTTSLSIGSRPGTAFEQFLRHKREGAPSPLHYGPDEPTFVPSLPHPDILAPKIGTPSPAPRPSKPPRASASPVLHDRRGSRPVSTASQQAALLLSPAPPGRAVQPQQLQAALAVAPVTPDYGQLAQAAASLASVAKTLAIAPKADMRISRSYEKLAAAASELASNVLCSTPQLPAPHQQHQQHQQAPPDARNSLMPFGASAAAPGERTQSAGRGVGTPMSSRKVATPKYPSYNPLIHIRTSELPMPGTPAQNGRTPATPGVGPRPSTGNPITHELLAASRPGSTWAPGSSRAGSAMPGSRSGPQTSGSDGRLMGPGDAGSDSAQVLVVDHNRPSAASRPVGGAGVPVELTMQPSERVRLMQWPPPRISEEELKDDDLALKYNSALAQIRDRIYTKGAHHVINSFKAVDIDRSGCIDHDEFCAVLRDLDLGPDVLDDKVIRLLTNAMDADHDGTINYTEFLGAIRFNKVPYKALNPKFKHRTTGNPEQPFGPTSLTFPFGTLNDVEHNTAGDVGRLERMFVDMRAAFRDADSDSDGVVDYMQFKKAMQALDERYHFQYTDEYIRKVFREADSDYVRGVRYEDFINSAARPSGAKEATSVAGGSVSEVPSEDKGRFPPEFMKPKTLRCSQLGAPWEWKLSPAQQQQVLLAQSADTLQRLGTASGSRKL
eukprot:CAMPEP_0202920578 /NCGR_PEP_ID=MMETSP1392-20130828/76930_1 /ASSEMBLY_ACC=CAM_ASM_000868 /TAXON_ID=225041 /ORGANISM="Chlamydomonas chlamydogama, Strain SAG 11-48b" /LENGTH=666 /DNA_ID=CAMNT_0049614081 /DNA_START=1168 /DNA_END=3168 /DNA_ORIENTATION=-